VLNPSAPTLHEAPATAEPRGKGVVGGLEILSRRVRRQAERHVSPHENVLFCMRGSLNHSLIALDERLIIVKPGFHAGSMWGALTTTFYYQDVTGIQLHTFVFSGWLEVNSPSFQGRERKRNRHRIDDYGDALRQLRERVELSKRPPPAPSEGASPLIASLERIASLRRSGALSEPEYARLKGVLLESADGGITLSSPADLD
jgi:hypothetical protein